MQPAGRSCQKLWQGSYTLLTGPDSGAGPRQSLRRACSKEGRKDRRRILGTDRKTKREQGMPPHAHRRVRPGKEPARRYFPEESLSPERDRPCRHAAMRGTLEAARSPVRCPRAAGSTAPGPPVRALTLQPSLSLSSSQKLTGAKPGR